MKTAVRIMALFLCASALVFAQGTAQIHGTIQDSTGAAVPGAEVKAIQTDTGLTRAATSTADGGFILTPLPIGPYRIEVAKEGFTKAVQTGIVLQVGTDPAIDIALKVGAVTEQVNVEANAALVETRSSGIGEVIQNQRIVELPLNGRNVTDLIALGGASVQTGNTQTRWFSGLPVISIGGGVAGGGAGGSNLLSTDYSLDGASHLSYLNGTTMPVAFPDAVQEFKAETSGQTAQRGASTSVSIVTKSGTNSVHGDLFAFIRNDGFGSAREYFSTTDSTYKRNQFGGTAGGPIKKDKLFIFGGYQGTTVRQTLPNTSQSVPTSKMFNGDFSGCVASLRAANINNNPATPALISGTTINTSSYTPQALYIAKAYANNLGGLPQGPCGQVTYQVPTHENDGQYVGKVDYQMSDRHSLFFRIIESTVYYPAPLTGCSFDKITELLSGNCLSKVMLNAGTAGEDQLASSAAVGDTYVISPTMVNSARLSFNRTAATLHSAHLFTLCDAGVGNGSQGPSGFWCGGTPGQLGGASISGGFNYGSGLGDGDFWNGYSGAFNDDVSWLKGAHQITFGFGWLQGRVVEFNHFSSPGVNGSFSGAVTGSGTADFFLGDLSAILQGLPNAYSARQNIVNLYFTDTWRINSRLTFNFGIRWEPFLPQSVTNGQISNFSFARFQAGTKSTIFSNAPPGFYFPGDPGFPGTSSANRQWMHFDPRGGIAWDPKGDGKTSIRASYAFGYAYLPGIAHEDEGGSNPWGGRVTLSTPLGGLANPWQGQPGGNPYPYGVTPDVKFLPGGQYMYTDYNLPTTTSYSWNLAAQRQIGTSWVASVTYLGSRVQHLYINQAVNYAPIIPGAPIVTTGCAPTALNCNAAANLQARRILSLQNGVANPNGVFVGNMDTWYPYGTQLYSGLLSSVQKRFSRGVSMSANWTWSHCIGYYQGFNSKTEITATNPFNPLGDRGNCDSDRRHIINVTAVAQAPKFSNRAMSMVVSGWQLAGIYKYLSGAPFAVQDGTDQQLSGLTHQRPNLTNPDGVYSGQTCGGCAYLNKSAFTAQPLGTVGNLGWNSVITPAYWDLDLALSRDFRYRERYSLQVRADAFNLTNAMVPAFNPSNPAVQAATAQPTSQAVPAMAALNNGAFGIIANAFPTRKIQFALKLTF